MQITYLVYSDWSLQWFIAGSQWIAKLFGLKFIKYANLFGVTIIHATQLLGIWSDMPMISLVIYAQWQLV